MNLNKSLTPFIANDLEEPAEQGLATLTPALERLFNELMKIEREQILQAAPYERTVQRRGYANGFKNKTLQTRFGTIDLHVPQTRGISFDPSCLEKGVSTRRVKKITEKLCGLEVSSAQVSRMAQILDEELAAFKQRPLGRMK